MWALGQTGDAPAVGKPGIVPQEGAFPLGNRPGGPRTHSHDHNSPKCSCSVRLPFPLEDPPPGLYSYSVLGTKEADGLFPWWW